MSSRRTTPAPSVREATSGSSVVTPSARAVPITSFVPTASCTSRAGML